MKSSSTSRPFFDLRLGILRAGLGIMNSSGKAPLLITGPPSFFLDDEWIDYWLLSIELPHFVLVFLAWTLLAFESRLSKLWILDCCLVELACSLVLWNRPKFVTLKKSKLSSDSSTRAGLRGSFLLEFDISTALLTESTAPLTIELISPIALSVPRRGTLFTPALKPPAF